MQCASWGEVKTGWTAERLGWFDERNQMVGVALVMHRRLPVPGRSIAYVPDGPVVDWAARPIAEWLEPLVAHLRGRGVVSIRIGPQRPWRRWTAATVKAGAIRGRRHRIADL